MNFEQAKAIAAQFEAQVRTASEALQVFPRTGSMGMTPDEVKFSPEFSQAQSTFDWAFKQQRAFNSVFLRRFKKELAAERRQRRKGQ